MLWLFILVAAAHLLVVAADIWTTRLFLARGGREKGRLALWFMRRFDGGWWIPKVGLSLILLPLAGYIWLDGAHAWVAILVLAVPALYVGATGVYQNLQWLRDH